MKIVLRSGKIHILFQTINIICAVLVSSYILFDVLDLDGSDGKLAGHSKNSQLFVVKDIAVPEPVFPSKLIANWHQISTCFIFPREAVLTYFSTSRITQISVFESSQRHGYRVALPRSAIPLV